MSSSREYWREREDAALKTYIKDEKEYDKEVKKIYQNQLNAIQTEINAFYGKYAKAEGITIAEAKKRVSQHDVKAFESKAAKYVKDRDFSAKANEELRLYNATMKINRLEMLKANIGLEMIAGHDELDKFMAGILKGRTEEELKRQAGILGKTIVNNAKLVDSVVNASFKNATFSDRIWMHQGLLKNKLSSLLQSGMIQGKNPRVLARELKNAFNTSTYDAERLMRTELARVQTEAQKQSFKRNGFTLYEFIANSGCCDICQEKDGKHFKVENMMPGENAAPMHPNCRCSAAPWEDSEEYEAWLDYLDKGGTTEQWNAKDKAIWKSQRRHEKKVENSGKSIYNGGIPKSWSSIDAIKDDAIKNTNPYYNSGKQDEYFYNCFNCISAYEMRKRGYDVIAKSSTNNRYLSRYPEAAWNGAKVNATKGSGYRDVLQGMADMPDGARVEIAIVWDGDNGGHLFVAEKTNGEIKFHDPQKGTTNVQAYFENVQDGKTKYWRIDNIEPSDRGITACEKVSKDV